MNLDPIAGIAHAPQREPHGVAVLTHGAGGNRDSQLLQQVCDEWARRGWLAVRYNLPYRRRRPKGPPSGSATADQAGIAEAIEFCRGLADGPLVAGGHSYGGRQTSMVAATGHPQVDVLTLFSYPVHPPGKPERSRTEHLPDITVPTVFTHGTSDPFGTLDELRDAAALIPAPTELVEITGARHDLRSKTLDVADLAVTAALRLLRPDHQTG
ncbi:alpha/beta hydrolase [Mycobacterium asiaticum]|uniref:Alpha/beta hydrolase n=1 Tax=Mycobacterium asiaticum TaxID=1790 RepID=A0A1A3NQH3_MYCAS|nr:alpha/beta family hydrolase [Mycobacterium asiaticum]OBK22562.1 alpha/beta hydrolase [Mycobacterium asiaticum]